MIPINEPIVSKNMKKKGYNWVMVFDKYDPLYVKDMALVCSLLGELPPKAIFEIDSFTDYLETNTL